MVMAQAWEPFGEIHALAEPETRTHIWPLPSTDDSGLTDIAHRTWNSESRMRENRLSGLMRGGKQTVIGPRASQSVASCLLYTEPDNSDWVEVWPEEFASNIPGRSIT